MAESIKRTPARVEGLRHLVASGAAQFRLHTLRDSVKLSSMRLVLIVDDDEDVRQSLRMSLTDEGYEVLCAQNGAEALEIIEHLPRPCLILLDLIMPVMNGWEFRARQSADPRLAGFPVVAMTATKTLEAAAIDAHDLLHKPLELSELLAVVRRHTEPTIFDDDGKTHPDAQAPEAMVVLEDSGPHNG
jgi:CheY-like chemotaxis protein